MLLQQFIVLVKHYRVNPYCVPTVSSCFVLLLTYHSFLLDVSRWIVQAHQDYFTGTGAILWLPWCLWSNTEWCGLIRIVPSQYKCRQDCVHNWWELFYMQDSCWWQRYKRLIHWFMHLCKTYNILSSWGKKCYKLLLDLYLLKKVSLLFNRWANLA